jgi:predicted permease
MGESTAQPLLGSFFSAVIYVLTLVLAGVGIRVISGRVNAIKRPTELLFKYLNWLVIWVVLPFVIFVSIARYTPTQILGFGNALVLAFMGLGVCFGSSVLVCHLVGDDRKTTVAITLNSSFMNVTYLGLPVVYALLGGGGLGPASLYAVGIGVPHLILGIMLASSAAKKHLGIRSLIGSVIIFPATFALIVALLFVGFGATLPTLVRDFFDVHLAGLFFAIMLLVIGYQMVIVRPHKYAELLTTVGAIRFLICPLVTYVGILALGLNMMTALTPKPALIQSVMPPGIFNLILAYNYNLDRELYGALVFYLTLISLFIVLPMLILLVPIG